MESNLTEIIDEVIGLENIDAKALTEIADASTLKKIKLIANFSSKNPREILDKYEVIRKTQLMFYLAPYKLYLSLTYERFVNFISNKTIVEKLNNYNDFNLCVPFNVPRPFMITLDHEADFDVSKVHQQLIEFVAKHGFNILSSDVINYIPNPESLDDIIIQVKGVNLQSTFENIAMLEMFLMHYEYECGKININQLQCRYGRVKKYPIGLMLSNPEWFSIMLETLNSAY